MASRREVTSSQHSNEPNSRLTRLADVALKAIEADPDYREGDRVFVALHDGASRPGHGGVGSLGYENARVLAADMALTITAAQRHG